MLNEQQLEDQCIAWFQQAGWRYAHGPDIAPEGAHAERADFRQVVLRGRLLAALARINPHIPAAALEEAAQALLTVSEPLGERAGSGMSRILHGWRDLGHRLRLTEHYEPQAHSVLAMQWAAAALTPTASPASSGERSGESSGETSGALLALLAQNPKLTAPTMAQSLGLTPRAIEKQLAKLKAQGRLRRVGPNKGGHWEVLEP